MSRTAAALDHFGNPNQRDGMDWAINLLQTVILVSTVVLAILAFDGLFGGEMGILGFIFCGVGSEQTGHDGK